MTPLLLLCVAWFVMVFVVAGLAATGLELALALILLETLQRVDLLVGIRSQK
jgi:hypothetical protein